ncbi:MAG TPA: glycosyltransferase family 39 protein [Pyrinomonadaceae bacterium]|nr:glycosyltransferase family 39 protein [Pyrinomonadaceae bacterium]
MQKSPTASCPPLHESENSIPRRLSSRLRSRVAIGISIFLIALGVRLLTWHDTRLDVGKIQTAVVADYHRVAQLLHEGGLGSFVSRTSPLADLNNLGHPPGYSLLIATVYSIKQSDASVQSVQMTADALSAVLIFLIVVELCSSGAGVIAGLLAALSPQLAWNSVLLLPDSISVLPILLAIYFLARAIKKPRLPTFVMIGALIGVSCWLRANAMFLTFFVAASVAVLITAASRWKFALAVICGTLLIVFPLTIRNAIVFHHFIPLSLGAGQTLLEGIADYDKAGRFGVPETDVGIMKQEAQIYQRPDYYGTLFNPDGVERERARLSRGFAIIGAHPFWFAGVMAKRSSSMLRLERTRSISTEPAITHPLNQSSQAVTPKNADGPLRQPALLSFSAKLQTQPDSNELTITGDNSSYGAQAAWPIEGSPIRMSDGRGAPQSAHADLDYLVKVPIRMERGRMRLSIVNGHKVIFSTAVVETIEGLPPANQPVNSVQLPFVADGSEAQLVISNEGPANSQAEIGPIEVYELGPARFLWTRYPRAIIHAMQKIFLTAVMLPLAVIGLLILIFRKQGVTLLVLSVVPIYFFLMQSLVHTEYRYVLAVTYFLFAFAGIAVCATVHFAFAKISSWRAAPGRSVH